MFSPLTHAAVAPHLGPHKVTAVQATTGGLDVRKREGKTPKAKKSGDDEAPQPMTIYLPRDVRKELLYRRVDESRTASAIVTDALLDYFKAHPRKG
jgi:hypothetical protein